MICLAFLPNDFLVFKSYDMEHEIYVIKYNIKVLVKFLKEWLDENAGNK